MAERAGGVQIYGIHGFLQDVLFPYLHYAYIFEYCIGLGGLFIRRPWVPKIEGFAENVVPLFNPFYQLVALEKPKKKEKDKTTAPTTLRLQRNKVLSYLKILGKNGSSYIFLAAILIVFLVQTSRTRVQPSKHGGLGPSC